jgi:hypothetical protein
VILQCGFWFTFSKLPVIQHLPCGWWPFAYLLWRNVHSSPLPIFWLACLPFSLLSCKSLYIWFADILSQHLSQLFIFLIMSSNAQKVLISMKYKLFFFCCSGFCCYIYLSNHCLAQDHKDLPLCFLLWVL